MMWDRFLEDWKQITGRLKDDWREWIGDEPSTLAGMHDQFTRDFQPRFAYAREQQQQEYLEFSTPKVPRCR